MRASRCLGFGLLVMSALLASSASTKIAEAHAEAQSLPLPSQASSPAAPERTPAAFIATTASSSARAPLPASELDAPGSGAELVTPPPAIPYLENPKLRRLRKAETSPGLLQVAARIVRTHHAKPLGTQVEVVVEGRRVVARIERHFHPEGGPVKPWGFHPGVSLFVYR
jgi:hypothetical protein